jgi:hypothetical protein
MSFLSRDELRMLTDAEGPCVSLFMPTDRSGAQNQQAHVRLKNLAREAKERLLGNGLGKSEVESILEPAGRFLDDVEFWQHLGDGLAIFLARGFYRRFRLPLDVVELVVTADRFHLAPLLPLMSGDGRFYILSLSQNRVRLFEGSRHSVVEVDLRDVPRSLADALGHDWKESSLQLHTGSGGAASHKGAMFHGHGGASDGAKEEIGRYLKRVDKGLREPLNAEQSPLVVAAVDYLISIYREVSHYPKLVPDGIPGNPDELGPKELHTRAWSLVEPIFLAAEKEAEARCRELLGTGRASSDVREIVRCAFDGRVEVLFVSRGVQRWGRFDAGSRQVELRDEPEGKDEDLLNLAALHCLLNGGTAYAVPPGEVPGGRTAAAVLRY